MPQFFSIIFGHSSEEHIGSCPAGLRSPVSFEIKTGLRWHIEEVEKLTARNMRSALTSAARTLTVVYYSKEPRQKPVELKRTSHTLGWQEAPAPIPFLRDGLKFHSFPSFKYKVNPDGLSITVLSEPPSGWLAEENYNPEQPGFFLPLGGTTVQ